MHSSGRFDRFPRRGIIKYLLAARAIFIVRSRHRGKREACGVRLTFLALKMQRCNQRHVIWREIGDALFIFRWFVRGFLRDWSLFESNFHASLTFANRSGEVGTLPSKFSARTGTTRLIKFPKIAVSSLLLFALEVPQVKPESLLPVNSS